MNTPDITPAQISSVVGSVVATALSLGLPISTAAQDKITLLTAIIAPVVVAADAAIRIGRARFLGHTVTSPAKGNDTNTGGSSNG